MRLALDSDNEMAFEYFSAAFNDWMLTQARFACFRYGVTDERDDNVASGAYSRFWQSLHGKSSRLKDYEHGLRYLIRCARSAVLDNTKGFSVDPNPLEDERDIPDESREDNSEELWQLIKAVITDEKDLLLVDCYILQGLKPRHILEEFPDVWRDTEEIRVNWQRVRRRLRRNGGIRRWFDIDDVDSDDDLD
jgi:hypothetical protein